MAWPPPIEEMRVRIGLASGDATRDADIVMAQNIALEMVETYLDRKLLYAADVEDFYSASVGHLVRRWPIDPEEELKIIVKGIGQLNTNFIFVPGTSQMGAGNYFAIDWQKGIINSPHYAFGWPLEISYTGGFEVMPDTLTWALLKAFDLVWANDTSFGNTTGSTTTEGVVKKVSLVGIGSVELEGSAGSSGGDGGGNASQPWGLFPSSLTSVLNPFRRESAVGVG